MCDFDPVMTICIKRIGIILLLLPLMLGTAHAQLRGHGGPVRALAVSPDGKQAVSGSFDTSAIRWSLERNVAEQVMRFHDGAVNAVAYFNDGRIATAGVDARVAIWTPGRTEPDKVLEGHTAPIAGIAVSPDGSLLASVSWDLTVWLWPLNGGKPRVLEGHTQNVNAVAFSPDGGNVVSAGYDATVRIWMIEGNDEIIRTLASPLNAVAVAPDGEIVAAGASGKVFFLSPQGDVRAEVEAAPVPIIGLSISPDGKLIAAAGLRGSVAIIDRRTRALQRTLIGPGLPVWSVAFLPDNRTLLTGGTDNIIRRWNALSGGPVGLETANASSDPLAAYLGDPGAEIFRACIACHTLNAGESNKAGPTLAGIFGRRIATLPGFNFSPALKKLDIVWTPETVAKLFEVGPAAYTPGTKMPEQRIRSAQDRKALTDFLARVTARNSNPSIR